MTPKERAAMQQALEMMDAGSYIPAMRVLREALAEQAEQEPVAYTNIDQLGYLKDPLYENAPMAMWSKQFDERINVPLYAAPVRTKDLTDDEIGILRQQYGITSDGRGIKEWVHVVDFARAVIAADREKNK